MKVLMFGWEFPPLSSGGLGTACYGLTKGLSKKGVDITFVLPSGKPSKSHVKLVVADNVKIIKVGSDLKPYISSSEYLAKKMPKGMVYGSTLFQEVYRYAQRAKKIAKKGSFDVIHCHDWMTYPAGIILKKLKRNLKPGELRLSIIIHKFILLPLFYRITLKII